MNYSHIPIGSQEEIIEDGINMNNCFTIGADCDAPTTSMTNLERMSTVMIMVMAIYGEEMGNDGG